MDGNASTWWDALASSAWLDVQFDSPVEVTEIEITSMGDTTHDTSVMSLQSVIHSGGHSNWSLYPRVPATAVMIQARTPFESFDPMELAANSTEVDALATRLQRPPYMLFTEHREYVCSSQ
jgi:hypothetical protein